MKPINSYENLEDLGRVRLSANFFMRDFLHSEIAAWHKLHNFPHHPGRAIEAGQKLCEELLEPLQATFGRIHIRSGYRSPEVNEFGNVNKLNCARNELNFAGHIWDYPNETGSGAAACIVIPWLVDHIEHGGSWTDMAWWIHDNLPYSSLHFFAKLGAFNINWHEKPVRRIDSYVEPKGCLTRPGMPNYSNSHADCYAGFPPLNPATPNSLRPPKVDERVPLVRANRAAPPRADTSDGGRIRYRAVHTKTAWRKVHSPHASMENALYGKDGAAGLFAGQVRIDYEKHGQPLYALVWQEGFEKGFVVKGDPGQPNGIRVIETSSAALDNFEQRNSCDVKALAQLFNAHE